MIALRDVEYSVLSAEKGRNRIIKNLSLDIETGENVALMGHNGSGKTTFLRLLSGLILPTSGKVEIEGLTTDERSFRAKLGRVVGMVFQNPDDQLLSIDVEREIALGLENYSLPAKWIKSRVSDSIDHFNLGEASKRISSKLSGGEKQLLATASVLILEPGVILFDESTAHLDRNNRKLFYDSIAKLKSDPEICVIFVTQSFAEAEEFERLLVFYEGRLVADCAPTDIVEKPHLFEKYKLNPSGELMIEKATADLVQLAFEDESTIVDDESESPGKDLLLRTEGLDFDWPADPNRNLIKNLDLELETASVCGIIGPTGSGKTSLALLLAGLITPTGGSISGASGDYKQSDLVRLTAYQFQQAERGMFAETVFDEIAFAPRNLGIPEEMIDEIVTESMELCGLDYERMASRSPFSLSGGEARMAAIASIVSSGKKLMIFDEPTVALDAVYRDKISILLDKLRKMKRAVVVISHDSDFIFENCDRLYLHLSGRFVSDEKYKLYKHSDLFAMAGADVPPVIRLAEKAGQLEKFRSLKINSLSHPLCQKLMKSN